MINLYDATIPVFTKHLLQIDKWLDKATALADQKKFDPEVLTVARLAPDQYSLTRQIQAACDQTKFTASKLAGKEAPKNPDTETTISQLRTRIETAVAYLRTFTKEDFVGAEDRSITYAWMGGKSMRGGDYLDHMALPNLHFHLTTAYAILRHNGVPLSKSDYIGDVPFAK